MTQNVKSKDKNMEAVFELEETKKKKGVRSRNHAYLQYRLILEISYLNKYQTIPEVSLLINGKEKIPDLAFYKNFEFRPNNDEVRLTDLPLGVVEILSPKQHISELSIKSKIYLDAGIKSYWLVVPDLKSIYVYNSAGEYEGFVNKGILKDRELDIELDLEKLFGQ